MSYEGFVDSEGFDGGDGQVGVVGDGEHALAAVVDCHLHSSGFEYRSVPRFLHRTVVLAVNTCMHV